MSSKKLLDMKKSLWDKKRMVNVDNLKRLRGTLSQRQLAKQAGVHFNSVQLAEKGSAGLNVLSKLARFFDVPVATLIKDDH